MIIVCPQLICVELSEGEERRVTIQSGSYWHEVISGAPHISQAFASSISLHSGGMARDYTLCSLNNEKTNL